MRSREKLVCGVGINDSEGPTSRRIDGKMIHEPCYQLWRNMISRSYNGRKPIYDDVSVCDEWKRYSVFKAWWEENRVPGYALDKDLKAGGQRLYSPDTCMFVPVWLNVLIRSNLSHLRGVTFDKNRNKYKTRGEIKPFYGYFHTEEEAHRCWDYHEGHLERERIQALDISIREIFEKWVVAQKPPRYLPDIFEKYL